jgi:threonine dehydratase
MTAEVSAPELVTLEAIQDAASRIAGVAVETPLVRLPLPGGRCLVKAESLQPIGAFKIRGAYNAIASLSAEARERGVIAASSGNHGMGVARSARLLDAPATVVMPADASPVKMARIRADGAAIVEWDPGSGTDLHAFAFEIAAVRDQTFIHPFDNPDVIAGQGTVGLEIATAVPDLAAVLVPVGGGGLISGTAAAIKALRPAARVIGVEPALAADARDSFRARRLVEWPTAESRRTIADGTRTNLSERTLAHLVAHVDDIIVVTEDEIRSAMAYLATEARLVAEPSGALTTAALLHHRGELGIDAEAGPIVAVMSGGNVNPDLLAEAIWRGHETRPA